LIYPPYLRTADTLPWETLIIILGKTVRQTPCTSDVELLQHEIRNSFLRTAGFRIVSILVLLTVEYGA